MNVEPAKLLESPLKAKARVVALAAAMEGGGVTADDCRLALPELSDVDRGTVLEALERGTRKQPELVDDALFDVLVCCLEDPAPRARWEASRVIANVAARHGHQVEAAVGPLLANTHAMKGASCAGRRPTPSAQLSAQTQTPPCLSVFERCTRTRRTTASAASTARRCDG